MVATLVAASTARSETDATTKIGSADVTNVAAAASSTMAPAASLLTPLVPTLVQLPAHADLPTRETRQNPRPASSVSMFSAPASSLQPAPYGTLNATAGAPAGHGGAFPNLSRNRNT
jgi:hypothetical protein